MRKYIVHYPYKCSGCHICEQACAYHHLGTHNYTKAKLKINQVIEVGKAVYFKANICKQCKDAPCINACPTGAIHRNKDGIIVLDKEKCIGCMECVSACPYDAMFIHPELKYPLMCDLCYPDEPACVIACPMKALEVVEVKE